MRLNLTTAVAAVGACLAAAGVVAAVSTATHTSYALRPCSTCREVPYATEVECRTAAQAEAQRIGLTRTTGSAVYTCITRHNVIATFRANPVVRQARLTWTPPTQNTDGTTLTNLAGYRIHYGLSPDALSHTVQLPNGSLTTYTIEIPEPGTWHFSVRAYTSEGTESVASNVIGKVVL